MARCRGRRVYAGFPLVPACLQTDDLLRMFRWHKSLVDVQFQGNLEMERALRVRVQ